ncbi:MAG: peptidase S10 [Ideonella sp.]|nr:MAG: peptidase S10 [Burkholderiaceae bacterium]MBE7427703.1 peptidase S10 [Ideonella sp.]
MSDPTPAAKPDPDADKRQRETLDKLLARAPVTGSGHVVLASGRRLDYEVSAAFMPLTAGGVDAQRGEPQAAVFCVAYTVASAAPRPLCFAFNGGPGSASVWLHLGALGPKRVAIHDDGTMPAAPYAVQDNPLTWLEHFDLVFVDPPHTGYSIALNDELRKKLFSVDGDADALAEVVRVWLARHKRFGCPLYLAGESYGTTRGAAIADKLQAMGVALQGLILVSCAMDLQSLVFAPGNDLPYALFLPAFANVAQYHGRLAGALAASPQAARDAAEAFVHEEYLGALHAGARLDARTRTRVEKRLAELTGLPRALVAEKNLRIADETFFFELLRDAGRIVGRLEARVTGPMAASRTRSWEFDPGIEALNAPYTMAAMAYFAELGIADDTRYEVLNFDVNKGWNWNRGDAKGNGFASTSGDLARALRRNPHLRVLVASGRYDLGTPYSASDWSLAQLDAPADVLQRVTHRYYDAGHMMYTRSTDLQQLKRDLAGWIG